jgi:hypothetical protein
VGGALAGVSQVFSNDTAGAALTAGGSVVTWGDTTHGGNAACTPSTTCSPAPAGSLSSGVVYIASPFVDLPPTPASPGGSPSQGGGGTAVPTTVAALPGRTTCTRLRCTTTGRVPAGVTRVTQVASLTSRATQLSAGLTATALASGYSHLCALVAGGVVKCWGDNQHGQLGNAANADLFIPVPAAGLTGVLRLAAGAFHACAATASAVSCWGRNDGGQLGLGADIAISTQKLHVRGPMGLRELTTYKWVVQGEGQIRV